MIPRREAVSRSITSWALRPPFCWSVATSRMEGNLRNSSDQLARAQTDNSCASASLHRVLILRPAYAVFHREVLHRLHVQSDAIDLGQFWLQSADNLRAPRLRSSRGFRLIWMRPLLGVELVPSIPIKEERLATSGSFRITLRQLPAGSAPGR